MSLVRWPNCSRLVQAQAINTAVAQQQIFAAAQQRMLAAQQYNRMVAAQPMAVVANAQQGQAQAQPQQLPAMLQMGGQHLSQGGNAAVAASAAVYNMQTQQGATCSLRLACAFLLGSPLLQGCMLSTMCAVAAAQVAAQAGARPVAVAGSPIAQPVLPLGYNVNMPYGASLDREEKGYPLVLICVRVVLCARCQVYLLLRLREECPCCLRLGL